MHDRWMGSASRLPFSAIPEERYPSIALCMGFLLSPSLSFSLLLSLSLGEIRERERW